MTMMPKDWHCRAFVVEQRSCLELELLEVQLKKSWLLLKRVKGVSGHGRKMFLRHGGIFFAENEKLEDVVWGFQELEREASSR